ncbi:DUF1761 domain-containing protein [Maricaulis parjimensis]|uniref:DUF1761 domain-containing protein n=1 Tax=Maricaulis parjimensis TaxID=144023 RepID=UPI0019394DCD|nr:DUF1761 domain-containing protein [Maricaulis parjimensis]
MPRILGLNPLAVLVAGIAFWMVGAMWYGALFADLWFGLWGFTDADEARMEAVMAPAMLAGLFQCLLLAGFLGKALKTVNAEGLVSAIKWAVFFWAGFVLLAQAYGAIYALQPVLLLVLDGAHTLTGFVVMSVVLTLMDKIAVKD